MRYLISLLLTVLMLSGCDSQNEAMERAIRLRDKLHNANSCTFTAMITAEYETDVYEFSLECETDNEGNLLFSVISPQTIDGITGSVDHEGGKLTFDDAVLAFPVLADGQASPVSAPWILYNALCSGYLKGSGFTEEGLILSLNDSFDDHALQLTVYTDKEDLPVSAEIYWEGHRILSVIVENFCIL